MARKRDEPEAGFTLVETMVALFIITTTLLISLYATAGYFKSSRSGLSKVRGVQLASEQMERLKAVPWFSLGFYTDDNPRSCATDGITQCSGETAVPVLGPTRPAGASAPLPQLPPTYRGNITYTVRSYLTWATAATSGGGVKHLVVAVSWTVDGQASSAVLDALQSPTGSDVGASGAAGAGVSPSSTPSPVATTTATPTPSASASPAVAAPSIGSVSATPYPFCIMGSNPARSMRDMTVTIPTTRTGINDDVSIVWRRGTGVPDGEAYNTNPGVLSGSTVTFTMVIRAGTDMGPAVINPLPATIQIIRRSDGSVTSQSYSLSVTSC